MFNRFKAMLAVTAVFALALLAPMAAEAQHLADRDAKEVSDYVLTEAALAKYTKAVHRLQPLMEQLPQDCEGDEHTKSLNDMAARMDKVSDVKSALKAVGMTSREYLVVSFSVFQSGMAAWALDQPGGTLPPGMKPANVNFYRAHKAELEKLGELAKQADCDNSNR
ncbi:MAG: hypothetical protein OEV01_01170 [Nitrospira sp.]|nr:hypothetical protein [Nitrospira sp.]MDH4302443.1 hypothetical protein [Nitrospira sp.]MDH5192554.1 hypothetical protein [Nitrospira sp.]